LTDVALHASPPMTVDPRQYRHVMGHFPTGVTIVTSCWEGVNAGMTVNSITSVSLEPPTLLVCLRDESRTAETVLRSGRFAVNILRENQSEVSALFARPLADHFQDLQVSPGPHGLPLIPGSLGHLICEVSGKFHVSDHTIVLGQIGSCEVVDGSPLVYYKSDYHVVDATR